VPETQIEFDRERAESWRSEIVKARIRLAEPGLAYEQRSDLWSIVDFREWCLRMMVTDYRAELEQIDREIETALRP
jgi:hypothetical protein